MKDDAVFSVWLSLAWRGGRDAKHALREAFGGARAVFEAGFEDIGQCLLLACGRDSVPRSWLEALAKKDLSAAEQAVRSAERCGADIVAAGDPEYPASLSEIADGPVALFCAGDVGLLSERGVAIVGTRRASPYGRWAACEISRRVASCGEVVISGMAEGIDSAAQRTCLDCGGKTVAVLGTGIDICFPASSRRLYEDIRRKGLLVSEYPPGERGWRYNFPERNRIISGLCSRCVIVEGTEKSGSMITAGLALEQGREVFAVPGNIDQPASVGVNKLIYDGACPITGLDSVEKTLGIGRGSVRAPAGMSDAEKRIYDVLEMSGSLAAEVLAMRAGLGAQQAAQLLTAMELKGIIKRIGGLYTVA